jgi:transposase InsO family protein
MPWKERTVSEQRLVLVHRVVELKHPLTEVAREMQVSRKTAYKWVGRYRADPQLSMEDRSRRPHSSPGRTCDTLEARVLSWRDQHRWGARKIHRLMRHEQAGSLETTPLPSVRTIATILRRHNRVGDLTRPIEDAATQRFERSAPNQLWQIDHKGAVEIGRQKYCPLVILDDHSRYCLRMEPVAEKTVATAWSILWDLLGEVGLPESILTDNAFSADRGLSWFDARLVRLNINPIHGRPYHPQTQGKVERFNGTMNRELIHLRARRDCLDHFRSDGERWRRTYNTLRPHESLGDEPPAARWKPSSRTRPPQLPEVVYPADATLRKVTQVGDVYYRNRRILVGRCMGGDHVRIEDRGNEIAVYYSWKLIRVLGPDQLGPARCYKQI